MPKRCLLNKYLKRKKERSLMPGRHAKDEEDKGQVSLGEGDKIE